MINLLLIYYSIIICCYCCCWDGNFILILSISWKTNKYWTPFRIVVPNVRVCELNKKVMMVGKQSIFGVRFGRLFAFLISSYFIFIQTICAIYFNLSIVCENESIQIAREKIISFYTNYVRFVFGALIFMNELNFIYM